MNSSDHYEPQPGEPTIGMEALISENSEYKSQRKKSNFAYGKVEEIQIVNKAIWYHLRFPNNYRNSYRDQDLVWRENFQTNREALSLLSPE